MRPAEENTDTQAPQWGIGGLCRLFGMVVWGVNAVLLYLLHPRLTYSDESFAAPALGRALGYALLPTLAIYFLWRQYYRTRPGLIWIVFSVLGLLASGYILVQYRVGG